MKNKTTSVLRLLAAVASLAILGAVTSTVHADTNAPAAAPAATPAAAPTPYPANTNAFASATLTNQVAFLEAAHSNSDPTPTGIAYESDPGHNAWMMVSAAFVLMMTLPGLALFYGGLVRSKNVLSIIAMCFGITALVSVLWWAVGYSLVFGANFTPSTGPTLLGYLFGGTENFFFKGVNSAPNSSYAFWVSQNVYSIFQLTFAIITPALIFGSTA